MSRLEGVKGLTPIPDLDSGEIKRDCIQGFEPRSESELQGRADARGQRSACCWRALLSSPQCARTGNSPQASARERCAASCPPGGRRETSPPCGYRRSRLGRPQGGSSAAARQRVAVLWETLRRCSAHPQPRCQTLALLSRWSALFLYSTRASAMLLQRTQLGLLQQPRPLARHWELGHLI